jgi:hypothetical protein
MGVEIASQARGLPQPRANQKTVSRVGDTVFYFEHPMFGIGFVLQNALFRHRI